MEDLTQEQCIDLIKGCWEEYGKHHAPSLTTTGSGEIDDFLRDVERLITGN